MEEPASILRRWKASLPSKVSVGSGLAKNPTAYKWKAPYRSLVLRETLFWRTYDLLNQAQKLHGQQHTLGSRLLLRGGLESVAVLAYLNQCTRAVIDGAATFEEYEQKTSVLLLGSRDKSTKHQSINVLTLLKHVDGSYPGVLNVYNTLSEAVHPNFEGVCFGYSEIEHEQHETSFAIKLYDMWAYRHDSLFSLVAMVFEHEYNAVWAPQQEQLEAWLVAHDKDLSPSKSVTGREDR